MANKRHKPEEVVTKLRQVDVLVGQGMARIDAGSRALLVSHWPVVSDAAVALTTRMLTLSRQGMTRAEAHRQAMIDTGPPEFWRWSLPNFIAKPLPFFNILRLGMECRMNFVSI